MRKEKRFSKKYPLDQLETFLISLRTPRSGNGLESVSVNLTPCFFRRVLKNLSLLLVHPRCDSGGKLRVRRWTTLLSRALLKEELRLKVVKKLSQKLLSQEELERTNTFIGCATHLLMNGNNFQTSNQAILSKQGPLKSVSVVTLTTKYSLTPSILKPRKFT